MQRRHFLSTLAGAAAVLALKPSIGSGATSSKTLIVIELAGGNDGLNTFIPYQNPTYLKLRPDLGIRDGIPVSSTVAFHPSLESWKPLLEKGHMAIVQNVGYPDPDLSHFRSQAIWQSASMDPSPDSGWLARYLGSVQASTEDAMFIGAEYPLALISETTRYLHLSPNLVVKANGSVGQAIQAAYAQPQSHSLAEQVRQTVLDSTAAVSRLMEDIDHRIDRNGYPRNGPVGRLFALTGQLIDSGAAVIYLTIGGWDTHAAQPVRHQNLLSILGQGIAALHRDLQDQGRADQVLIMVNSEFGRRPAQNGSQGTDHGTAGPVVLVGPVRGGFYGGDPDLDSLIDQNLPVTTDFRQIYAELLTQWFEVDPTPILAGSFNPVGILA